MKTLTSIFLLVILPLLLSEFTELAPRLAERTVRLAVKVLPAEFQERLAREWQGDVNRTPGKLLKLGRALGFLVWAYPNRRACLGLPTVREYVVAAFDWAGQQVWRFQARARRALGRISHRIRTRRDDRARPPPLLAPINWWTPARVASS